MLAGTAQLIFELLDHRSPALAAGVLAGIEAHPAQGFRFFQQPTGGVTEGAFIPGHGQHTVIAVAHMLGCCGLVVGHYRQPGRQGFQHHVAEGFGQAGKQEQIPTGVMGCQGFATLAAAEQGVGQAFSRVARCGPSPTTISFILRCG